MTKLRGEGRLRLGFHGVAIFLLWIVATHAVSVASGQDRRTVEIAPPEMEERIFGPYDVHVLGGGPAFNRAVFPSSRMLAADGAYTLSLWVKLSADTPLTTLLAGVGDPLAENSRFLGLREGHPMLRYGPGNLLESPTSLAMSGWHLLAASSDGVIASLYVDGKPVASGGLFSGAVGPRLVIAHYRAAVRLAAEHFGGDLVQVTLRPGAQSAAEMAQLATRSPETMLLQWHEASLAVAGADTRLCRV